MTISTAVDMSAVARVVGIKTEFEDLRGGAIVYLPQRVAVIGQGNTASTYATTKRRVTSALEVGNTEGFGSPLHLAVLGLLPPNGDGVGTIPVTIYPLDDDGAGVAAAGTITPSGTATKAGVFKAVINNIDSVFFSVAVGDVVADVVTALTAAIQATSDVPVTAADGTTVVNVTSKWLGASANDIHLAVEGPTDAGITFAIVQPVNGAGNPSIAAALAQIGNVWETLIVNCMEIADDTTLDAYQTFGDGRWGSTNKKPLMVFSGNLAATPQLAIVVPDARKSDRVNSQIVSPAAADLPCVVAARGVARIAKVANNSPPNDYARQKLTGLTPSSDGAQWDYPQQDLAIKGGSSTINSIDSVVTMADTVTFYHPTGDPTPAYRYVCDVVKITQIIFNLNLIFETPEWDGAPLVPDSQATTLPSARKPKDAKAQVNSMIDNLGYSAIISDPATAKKQTQVGISTQNPKRLEVAVVVQLSGNANIISVDLNFGFYVGKEVAV